MAGMALAWKGIATFEHHAMKRTTNMTKMKWLTLAGLVSSLSVATVTATEADAELNYRPFTFSAEASTLGFGGSFNWRFHDHFGARAGIAYFSYSRDREEIEGIFYNNDLTLLSAPLTLDIYPWANRSFRVSVGVLVNQSELESVVPQDPVAGSTFITIGNTSYDSSAIGNVNLDVEPNAVSPYLSIGGSFYLDKAKHWSLNGEIGVVFTGELDVSLSNSGPGAVNPADLALERQQIEDWTDDFQFYPILKISLSYSF